MAFRCVCNKNSREAKIAKKIPAQPENSYTRADLRNPEPNTMAPESASVDTLMERIAAEYGTLSKQQKNAPIGPAGLARIIAALHRRAPDLPVCGIAGIDAGNAAEVIAAGADGIAVISALSLVPDPQASARALRDIVDAMLAKRGA